MSQSGGSSFGEARDVFARPCLRLRLRSQLAVRSWLNPPVADVGEGPEDVLGSGLQERLHFCEELVRHIFLQSVTAGQRLA